MPRLPSPISASAIGRRASLLLALGALPGCAYLDSVFNTEKKLLQGTREPVLAAAGAADAAPTAGRRVVLPAAIDVAEWPQPGGNSSHAGGHPALRERAERAWTASIGESAGYRRRITASPVVAGGRVFTMDSDGAVMAFDAASGRSQWRVGTEDDDDRSTNVGGGIATSGDTLYAATGRGEVLALDTATGAARWRKPLGVPARSAPTIAGERMFVAGVENQMFGLSTLDGRRLWSYQSQSAETAMLGLPAPAHVDGIVVAGFGSGELVALRAASGSVAWSDSLAAARGRTSIVDLSAIRGMPVVSDGRVYATSLGRQFVASDLRSGRRLWERDIASGDTPWLAGDWLFVLSVDAQLMAIDRADGTTAWMTQLDRWENPARERDPITWTGPVLAGGRLIVAASTGAGVLVDPVNGAVLGQISLPGVISVASAAAGGTLYMVSDSATLLALR